MEIIIFTQFFIGISFLFAFFFAIYSKEEKTIALLIPFLAGSINLLAAIVNIIKLTKGH